jgi:predicted RNase H-like HicB family nuclease
VEFEISFDHEEDGRWIAEAVELPGVLAYGATLEEARAKALALATELIAEQAKKI